MFGWIWPLTDWPTESPARRARPTDVPPVEELDGLSLSHDPPMLAAVNERPDEPTDTALSPRPKG